MNKRKGFTLVELLAVIIILAVIMIIAIPTILDSTASAEKNTFRIYAQKAINAAMGKVSADKLSSGPKSCYTLTELGLETLNKYVGSVSYNVETKSYKVYLSNGEYIVQGLSIADLSNNDKIQTAKNITASIECENVIGGGDDDSDYDLIIAAYIYGEQTATFPTTSDYGTEVKCFQADGSESNATGEVKWNGTKWIVSVDNVDIGETKCKVYFGKKTAFPLKDLILAQGYDNLDTNLYTTPGDAAATADEGIRTTTDDYGTTYYYRGNVDDNFLVFANKCWRIVRITGTGDIKIVLYNDNTNGDSAPCEKVGSTLAFARYNGSIYTSKFNSDNYGNKQVGFMYGSSSGSAYGVDHENARDSIILTALKSWYDLSFSDTQKGMLADVIWCNDKSLYSGNGVGLSETKYGAYNRIVNRKPSLICPNDASGGNLSKFTASDTTYGNGRLHGVSGIGQALYKIGLLTPDEVAFAGGRINVSNTAYYLSKNATGVQWWTMGPYYIGGGGRANVFIIEKAGGFGGAEAYESLGIRSSVTLSSETKIKSGTGTYDDPFVVKE